MFIIVPPLVTDANVSTSFLLLLLSFYSASFGPGIFPSHISHPGSRTNWYVGVAGRPQRHRPRSNKTKAASSPEYQRRRRRRGTTKKNLLCLFLLVSASPPPPTVLSLPPPGNDCAFRRRRAKKKRRRGRERERRSRRNNARRSGEGTFSVSPFQSQSSQPSSLSPPSSFRPRLF